MSPLAILLSSFGFILLCVLVVMVLMIGLGRSDDGEGA